MLTHERLLELLFYDPLTGVFTRKVRAGKCAAGTISGSLMITGYWEISVDAQRYLAHRLAWFYMTSAWPPSTVDHENTIRSDNRWENLRLATKAEQLMNRGMPSHNKSGAKNIYWDEKNQSWCCEISANGIRHWLGRVQDFEDAKALVEKKRIEVHGQFARSE